MEEDVFAAFLRALTRGESPLDKAFRERFARLADALRRRLLADALGERS